MNNFNINRMFSPPNLFGMGRNYNRNYNPNYNPNSVQPWNDCEPDLMEPVEESDLMEPAGESDLMEPGEEPNLQEYPWEYGVPGPQGPRGEPGARGPAGPPGYPQNSIFASFLGQELILPENASLPLKMDIPDITQNISLCDDYSVLLTPGCYAVYYYISTIMKRHGFIELTPIFNDCVQTVYAAYAKAEKRNEKLAISRYFIAEIKSKSTLFFT